MRVDIVDLPTVSGIADFPRPLTARVVSETDRLTDVIVCPPSHLTAVPCCEVTRQSLRDGFTVNRREALEQHATLIRTLEAHDVRCHRLAPIADLPDMCFTRDIAVATPFGLVALNPAMPHRRGEVEALIAACEHWRLPVRRIVEGAIEGGDVCVAREGLLIVGMSGERSTSAGIKAFAAPFVASGWDVLICPFEAQHLHLDTIFCMVAKDEAIGCVELLDPGFLREVAARGIRVLPVPATSAATLGCNILALDDRSIIAAAGDDHVAAALGSAGHRVTLVDISQLTPCGGGIHCLTQPLRRTPKT